MSKRMITILTMLLAAMMLLAACGGSQPETSSEGSSSSEGAAETGAETAMPGEGTTVRFGRATWDTGYFQAELFAAMLEELGYEVENVEPLPPETFYPAAAQGDVDAWANGWFPLHQNFLDDDNVAGKIEPVGFQVRSGALQGFLIDKASADELGITSLEQFTDPAIAGHFDADGDGKADLTGCNPGWGCEAVINDTLDRLGLGDTVTHVQGEYSLLMADTISRYAQGEPIFFYTWTPNWTISQLKLGEDVVWIEVPETEDAPAAEGVLGCVADPCSMGFAVNTIRVVANSEFLANNPAAAALFEAVEIPLSDIADQNQKMVDGEDSDEDIARHAEEWLDANRDKIEGWLETARNAGN